MRFTSDFWIKKQDASDIKAGTLDGMATDSNLRSVKRQKLSCHLEAIEAAGLSILSKSIIRHQNQFIEVSIIEINQF